MYLHGVLETLSRHFLGGGGGGCEIIVSDGLCNDDHGYLTVLFTFLLVETSAAVVIDDLNANLR